MESLRRMLSVPTPVCRQAVRGRSRANSAAARLTADLPDLRSVELSYCGSPPPRSARQ